MGHPHAAQMLRSTVAQEYLYPDADIGTTSWTASSGSAMYAMVDEPTTPNDSDYIQCASFSKAVTLGFPAPSGTPTGSNIKLRVRGRYSVTGGQDILSSNATVEFMNGTTGVDTLGWNPSLLRNRHVQLLDTGELLGPTSSLTTDEGIVDDISSVSWIELEIETS